MRQSVSTLKVRNTVILHEVEPGSITRKELNHIRMKFSHPILDNRKVKFNGMISAIC